MKQYLFVGGSHGIAEAAIRRLLLAEPSAVVHLASREIGPWHDEPRVKWQKLDVASNPSGLDVGAINFEQFAGYVYAPGSINLRPFTSLKAEDFQRDFEFNVVANITILQKLIRPAKGSQFTPSCVFFSTVAAKRGMPMHSSIGTAKAAVEGLAVSLAAEYAPKFRFNVVAPSLTDTPLAEAIVSRESVLKASIEKHPLRRIGTSDDVAASVVFLLSDDSAWMTGQILRPDGGMSV